ncbi:serine hydrolase domain-containing protein [Blastococcus sp. CT_GayMR16]|uniref:serine hydrolase domain-containing protein n=1 Tax=Blastococcus sp. CT_GayMR16 TaxID=2559607 RepID=UPI001073C37B|nr:serine hydrolase domain-containing protein [Blastococcus sp. CT_GayMR16]TFV87572.1 class A beta-lactamase-related serine hydrolase [Blastococcus sp. CT_GayMR16]
MDDLESSVDHVAAATEFSGVVRVDRGGRVELAKAYGSAHRGYGIPNAVDTRFGLASGTKALTALSIVSLIEEGRLGLDTTARSLLGEDLPLIDDDVTVEHLLAHRSGIGDYFDEDAVESMTDYVMPIPVHRLATTPDYLAVLDGYGQVFPPGERFAYNNGGFVVLALIAERTAGMPFPEVVRTRVCAPAGMPDTEFLRTDEPGNRTALGYLYGDGLRTNVLHLPVCGSGDGGIYSTVGDIHALWSALYAGQIVPVDRVAEMVRPLSDVPSESMRYGLGFRLHPTGDAVILEGSDAGISFWTEHDEATGVTHTVLSNTSGGAWPVTARLSEWLTL